MVRSYKVCDLLLQSNLAFPELSSPVHASRLPDCTLQLLSSPLPEMACEWRQSWEFPDGRPWASLGRVASGYLLSFAEYADFLISSNAGRVDCYARANAQANTLRHLFLNQVLPLLLQRRGKLVLHASAVATPFGALAFMAETGKGKSTLAASFARNFATITDDCLALEWLPPDFFARPSYPGLRLWPDALRGLNAGARSPRVAQYTLKRRLQITRRFCSTSLRLRRIYLLEEEDEKETNVRVRRLRPSDGFMQLVKHTFRLDLTDGNALAREFPPYQWLSTSGAVRGLSFPREMSLLDKVKRAVLQDAASS